MTLFTNGPDGMTGNDDLGTMSAWYVFSLARALPDDERRRLLRLSAAAVRARRHRRRIADVRRARQGGTLTITAPGVSDDRRYVQSLTVDGARRARRAGSAGTRCAHGGYRRAHRRHDARAAGARRRPTCRRRPCRPDATRGCRCRWRRVPNPVVVPTGAREARLTVDLVGQAPKSLPVAVSVTAPAGLDGRVGSGDEGRPCCTATASRRARRAGDPHACPPAWGPATTSGRHAPRRPVSSP